MRVSIFSPARKQNANFFRISHLLVYEGETGRGSFFSADARAKHCDDLRKLMEGKDVLATAQTGTGKTLAFLIPVIERLLAKNTPGVAALVLVPTRELAMQVVEQYNVLRGKQLSPAALVVGGLAEGPQLSAIRKGARIIVATPGRLEDYLDRRLVQFTSLQTLVLDEADRMLDMGFLPAIRRIVSILPKDRQTMCFSATPGNVRCAPREGIFI